MAKVVGADGGHARPVVPVLRKLQEDHACPRLSQSAGAPYRTGPARFKPCKMSPALQPTEHTVTMDGSLGTIRGIHRLAERRSLCMRTPQILSMGAVLALTLCTIGCDREYVSTSQPGGGPSQQPSETVPMPDPDAGSTPRPVE